MLGKIGCSGTESKQQSKKGGYLFANSAISSKLLVLFHKRLNHICKQSGDCTRRGILIRFRKTACKLHIYGKVTILSSSISDL